MTHLSKMVLAMTVLGITLGGIRSSLAQTIDAAKAAKVKSAYLLNFAKFTTWPDGTFTDENSPLVICVWGRSALEKTLEQVIKGKTVNEREVVISRIEGRTAIATRNKKGSTHNAAEALPEEILTQLNECHLLYIDKTEANHVHEILKAVEPLSILTISDIPRFAEQGGMLGLVLRKGKITFDANPAMIKNSRIRVSSKILEIKPRLLKRTGRNDDIAASTIISNKADTVDNRNKRRCGSAGMWRVRCP